MSRGVHHATDSADATEGLGEELAGRLRSRDVLLLEGDLAAGKTTLVRGIVRGLGGDPAEVSSPSFVILQTYPCEDSAVPRLHHVDLYRLADRLPELREIGLDEVLSDADAVTAVEWPRETIATWLPADARLWRVVLTLAGGGLREIVVRAPEGA